MQAQALPVAVMAYEDRPFGVGAYPYQQLIGGKCFRIMPIEHCRKRLADQTQDFLFLLCPGRLGSQQVLYAFKKIVNHNSAVIMFFPDFTFLVIALVFPPFIAGFGKPLMVVSGPDTCPDGNP